MRNTPPALKRFADYTQGQSLSGESGVIPALRFRGQQLRVQYRAFPLWPRHYEELAGADFHVKLNGPEKWLAVVAGL